MEGSDHGATRAGHRAGKNLSDAWTLDHFGRHFVDSVRIPAQPSSPSGCVITNALLRSTHKPNRLLAMNRAMNFLSAQPQFQPCQPELPYLYWSAT
ncbi:MAG: hypothetical protein ABJA49_05735, partial [Betaproteobacteria bacterium]